MKVISIEGFFIVLSALAGCQEESSLPAVNTGEIDSITNTTAVAHGIILNTGGAETIIHGICWDTTANPTIDLITRTASFEKEKEFKHKLTDLTKNTPYYARTYAKTSAGTSYGDVVSFTSYNATEPSGDILALPSDVISINGSEVEVFREPGYFGQASIKWGPVNDPVSWQVSFSGVQPGSTRLVGRVAGVRIYFSGSTPPSESGVYQLKPDNTTLAENEASITYSTGLVTNEPGIDPSIYEGWSTNGTAEVTVIRGEVSISFSNVSLDSNTVISGNLTLR